MTHFYILFFYRSFIAQSPQKPMLWQEDFTLAVQFSTMLYFFLVILFVNFSLRQREGAQAYDNRPENR